MSKTMLAQVFLRTFAAGLLGCFFWASASAADFALVQDISFGHIIASPYADAIAMDASMGPAVPRNTGSGWSQVSGGRSGRIRYRPDTLGQQVQLLFPAKLDLNNGSGGTLPITSMNTHSTQMLVALDMTDHFLHIGGVLHVLPGASGTYSGTMTISITVLNP